MQDLTFYLANPPPLPVPRLDVDIGTLYYRSIEAADLLSLLVLSSRFPEPQKLDGQDDHPRMLCFLVSTKLFRYNCRQHWTPLDTTGHHSQTCLQLTANSLAVLALPQDLELDSVGVSMKIILVEWPWFGGLYVG